MLKTAPEGAPAGRFLPMSAQPPIGSAPGSGLGISAPASVVIGQGPQVSGTSSIVSAPLSGQLSGGLIKTGAGMQSTEEEVY